VNFGNLNIIHFARHHWLVSGTIYAVTSQLTDQSAWLRLFRTAKGGDGDALGRLLECYRSYLALLARLQISRRLQSKIEAADVVQDVMLEAHRNFASFRGASEGEFVAWLRRMVADRLANLVRHYQGTRRRDIRLEREMAAAVEDSSRLLINALAASQSSPSERAARREQAVLLAEALDELPGDQREVLVLHHLEGYTFPEIARLMERTVDSIKGLWTRGLAGLRRILGDAL
jgi:RNA polymerase sigma-70 factor, ECF subfamily